MNGNKKQRIVWHDDNIINVAGLLVYYVQPVVQAKGGSIGFDCK